MTKIPHCVQVYQMNLHEPYGHMGKWRQQKKFFKKQGIDHPVSNAYSRGQQDSYYGKPYRNNYPRGKRHEYYKYGYNTDWMGMHHGENV